MGNVPTWGGPTRRVPLRFTDLRPALIAAAVLVALAAGWFNWRAWHEERRVDSLRQQVAAAENAVAADRAALAEHVVTLDASVAALADALSSYRSLAGRPVVPAGYTDMQGPLRQWLEELRRALDTAREVAIGLSGGAS